LELTNPETLAEDDRQQREREERPNDAENPHVDGFITRPKKIREPEQNLNTCVECLLCHDNGRLFADGASGEAVTWRPECGKSILRPIGAFRI